MKKILCTILSILIITVCCSCNDSTNTSQTDNNSELHKSPSEIISELTVIEDGTELSQLEEMGVINLDVLGINADEYSYEGRFDAHVGGDYCLTDNSDKPISLRYQYTNPLKESILVDKYGRLLSAELNDGSNVSQSALSENELFKVASDCATRALGDKFQGYSVYKVSYSNYDSSATIYWKKEGRERFDDLIAIGITNKGYIYRIEALYSDLPDNYSYQEIDEIAEEWFEENLKKIYPETKSYVVDKNSIRNIDGKVYGNYVATITIAQGGHSCVELIVQDMSANESE